MYEWLYNIPENRIPNKQNRNRIDNFIEIGFPSSIITLHLIMKYKAWIYPVITLYSPLIDHVQDTRATLPLADVWITTAKGVIESIIAGLLKLDVFTWSVGWSTLNVVEVGLVEALEKNIKLSLANNDI